MTKQTPSEICETIRSMGGTVRRVHADHRDFLLHLIRALAK